MSPDRDRQLSPEWPGFRRRWWWGVVILGALTAWAWLTGYGPGGARCAPPLQERVVEIERSVVAPDRLAPVLKILGDTTTHLTPGQAFEDPGAIAVDGTDGEVEVRRSGELDTRSAGRYALIYSAADAAGNIATAVRTVIVDAVPDTQAAPVAAARDVSDDSPAAVARIFFAVGGAEPPNDSARLLAPVVGRLRREPDTIVTIAGFHDASGDPAKNRELARRRAAAVGGMLQLAGITANRIVLEKPTETTGSGTADEARRVEVRIRQR
ncbi:MAG: DUF5011 domain-containing protein [Gammaproteobacteria bacterium]|nr:DUF5011 domain-containing protein [Gammaproteobacteria bacterium]